MKFDCISSKWANENPFIIFKEYQKELVHTWSRGQNASSLRIEKTDLVVLHP